MLAIIDADVLCYKATYNLWQDVLKRLGYLEGTKYIGPVDEFGKAQLPREIFALNAEMLGRCWDKFEEIFFALQEVTFFTDYVAAVKGNNNYRYDIYPDYKGKRKPLTVSTTNEYVENVRELSVAHGLCIRAHNGETDDYLRVWANEAEAHGNPHIVVSIDKDLLCIPGLHYRIPYGPVDIRQGEIIRMDNLGALKVFYKQMLMGDKTVDNIPGIPGIGPVKADGLINPCKTEHEMQEVVVDAYMKKFANDWEHHLLANGKLLYLQEELNSHFMIRDWPVIKEIRSYG